MGRYLIYVTRFQPPNGRVTDVYDYSGDVFHAMGEIDFRSFEQIYRMNYVNYSESSVKFWNDEGVTIRPWLDKYPYYRL